MVYICMHGYMKNKDNVVNHIYTCMHGRKERGRGKIAVNWTSSLQI